MAYIEKHFLSIVRSRPFSLALGCIHRNLDELAATDQVPLEETIAQIWQLMRLEANRVELADAITELRQIRWSTALAEQLHGTAARLHKLHPDAGVESLLSRTMVRFLQHLVARDEFEKFAEKQSVKLQRLEKRHPEKAGAHQQLIGKVVKAAQRQSGLDVKMSAASANACMRIASKQFGSLSSSVRRKMAEVARCNAQQKRQAIEDDKAHIQESLRIRRDRESQAFGCEGKMSALSSCRLSQAERETLQNDWDNARPRDASELRRAALRPPESPAPLVLEALASVQVQREHTLRPDIPAWCRTVATLRDRFRTCALIFDNGSRQNYFAFVYAEQNPIDIALAPLQSVGVVGKEVWRMSPNQAKEYMDSYCDFEFSSAVGQYAWGRDLLLGPGEVVSVLPSLFYANATRRRSHGVPVPLSAYVADVPAFEKEKKEGAKQHIVAKDRLVEHPWLQRYLSDQRKPPDQGADAPVPAASSASEFNDLDADELARVTSLMIATMTAAIGDDDGGNGDFHCVLSAGNFAKDRGICGLVHDSVRAKAASPEVVQWCKSCGLGMSFSCDIVTMGNELANLIAAEWCTKMTHFYNFYVEHHDTQDMSWIMCAPYDLNASIKSKVDESLCASVRDRFAKLDALFPLCWPM